MQLVEIYALDLEASQAPLTCLAQVFRPAVGLPPSRSRPCEAALRGDDQSLRVRVESLGDQALRDLGAVGVGGVYEVYAELDRPPEDATSLLGIIGLSPDALSGDAHRAEAHAVVVKLAAQSERAG